MARPTSANSSATASPRVDATGRKLIEAFGARPASRAAALDAFARGEHVLVFPVGDLDGGKSFIHRNEIVFGRRRGFARLAVEVEAPIVPIVTAGAGESLLVLSDGRRLARALRLDRTCA